MILDRNFRPYIYATFLKDLFLKITFFLTFFFIKNTF